MFHKFFEFTGEKNKQEIQSAEEFLNIAAEKVS